MSDQTSEFVKHEPCPACGSRDNLARYDDDHAHCFGCGYYEHASGDSAGQNKRGAADLKADGMVPRWETIALKHRSLTKKTCALWRYGVGEFKGMKVHVANHVVDGNVVVQKIRTRDKDFRVLGDTKRLGLYGKWLWRRGGKYLCVTEGEIDAMSVSQAFDHKYPVVSLPNGAQGATKAIAKEMEWVLKFEQVVIMFDQDEPGTKAAKEVAKMLPPGRAKVAALPMKDANELLIAGRSGDIIKAFWNAAEYRPDSIVSVHDVLEDALAMPKMGLPWPWPTLTALTYGIHRRKCYYLGAGVGIGKTDWAKELQCHLVNRLNLKVGVFMLEESPGRTLKGIAGKFVGKAFHRPDGSFTAQDLHDAVVALEGKVYLFNHFGVKDWDTIKDAIRYMAHAYGIRDFFLDNLTALVSHLPSSEANDEINRIAGEAAGLVHELDISLYGFSHLNPPAAKGQSHERGAEVMESQFTGSRGLMRYGNYLFGLRRNKDPALPLDERNTSTFVLLKDREFGNSGEFPLFYDVDKGTYLEPPEGMFDDNDNAGAENDDF